ncbi:MAG: proprotein convertase P-domain-containing protein [Chloroflexota bacterium]
MNTKPFSRFIVLLPLLSLLVIPAGVSHSQVLFTSPPPPLAQGAQPLPKVELLSMPSIDVNALLAEDEQRAQAGLPPRFAQPIPVQASSATHGTWESLKDGSRLWRLRLLSAGAHTLNLGFSTYWMPPGGRLYLYPADYSHIVGPFTAADNEANGQLWTPIVRGEEIVIEVTLPAAVADQFKLELAFVNHDYKGFDNPQALLSGSCNLDVVCSAADGYPQVDSWRAPIRSVGVFTVGGVWTCTGALINNTAQDLTPYFLTANHCGVTSGNAASVVVYWNYENSWCRPPGSPASGGAGDGSLLQFNSGAIFRATYATSDFTLIQLDDPINPAFNPYFAGWDRSSSATTSAVGIHHPNTDEKRISFENDPTSITSYYGTTSPGNGSHIRITDWDLGTTEPGSSGSPLFSPQGRIIGQLHGGDAACGNNDSDWYGRFYTSWTGGGTSSTRLSNWLDPLGSGALTLDGKNLVAFELSATPETLSVCAPANGVYNVAVSGGASPVVSLSASGQPAGTTATFVPTSGTSPYSSVLTIGNTAAAAAGSYSITVTGTSGSNIVTDNVTFNLIKNPPGAVSLVAPSDGATGVAASPLFQWNAASQAASYLLEFATDSGFSNIVYSASVAGTSHTPATPLASSTLYYWRVTPQNLCGWGTASTVSSFTTSSLICRTPALSIPDNNTTGITDSLVVSSVGLLDDLNVYVNISHTWVGDLIVSLLHQDTGTSVTLIDRPGVPASANGCSYNSIDATLDDEAASAVESQCSTTPPAIGGTFIPNNPLSAFDGQSSGGTWRLTISDRASADTGTLNQWCLSWTVHQLPVYIPLVLFGQN